nr:MAG TPA: hypothetical protein [Caudoviricetes sp.]
MSTVKIVNPKQCAFYISGGIKPLDLLVDENTGRLIYLFDMVATKDLWEVWKVNRPVK